MGAVFRKPLVKAQKMGIVKAVTPVQKAAQNIALGVNPVKALIAASISADIAARKKKGRSQGLLTGVKTEKKILLGE